MNVYYLNKKATLMGSETKTEAPLINVYDSMLELRAEFYDNKVTINGKYGGVIAADSLCLGYTNAVKYELATREGTFTGRIRDRITIHNFDEPVFTDWFTLKLEGIEEPLYLGHLFLGMKTVLPRFAVGPDRGMAMASEAQRSFGGQVFGMKRITLKSFAADFPRITSEEYRCINEYAEAVQTVEPHIIDPYHGARAEFPPMYATLSVNELSNPKRDEDGFFYSGSLAWQEAR